MISSPPGLSLNIFILLLLIFVVYGFSNSGVFKISEINWYMILYVIVSAMFLVYGTSNIYSTGQIRGIIFGIGAGLVLFYFGLKWFGKVQVKQTQWPPVINMCPDYLTYLPSIKSTAASTRMVPGCVDFLGVTSSSNAASAFVKIQPLQSVIDALNATMTTKVFKYTSPDIKNASSASDLQTICDACQNAGLTWEGVYDGDSCVGIPKVEANNAAKEMCLVSIM
jgi:hypothetical protein